MISNKFLWGVLLAIIIHFVTLFLFTFEIIPQETKHTDHTFWFHHGGDEHGYYEQALSIQSGNYSPNRFPLGYPILLLPALWLIQPPTIDNLIEPVAFIWSVVIFPIALVMCGWLSVRLTNIQAGILATISFSAFPLLAWMIFNLLWNSYMAEIIAIHMTWAQMLSDGPAAFFTLMGAVVYIKVRDNNYKWRYVIPLGIILGFIVLIRLSAVIFSIVIGLSFLYERRFLKFVVLTTIALICFSPQLIYNLTFFGHPLKSGYEILAYVPDTGLFNIIYIQQAFSVISLYLGVMTIPSILLLLGITGAILYRLWQRDSIMAFVIGGWLIGYLIFYSLYYYSWTGAMMRFMIPVIPVVAILVGILIDWIIDLFTSKLYPLVFRTSLNGSNH